MLELETSGRIGELDLKTEKEMERRCKEMGENFCEQLSEIEQQLEAEGFSNLQAIQITIGSHLGAVLAFHTASGGEREDIMRVINGMLDDFFEDEKLPENSMKIKTWHEGMSDKETADIAYWERNMLALLYADGWYNDVIPQYFDQEELPYSFKPRYAGWSRILSLKNGSLTFHIQDDFDVGNLPEINRNWDGHTTEEKWTRVARKYGIKVDEGE